MIVLRLVKIVVLIVLSAMMKKLALHVMENLQIQFWILDCVIPVVVICLTIMQECVLLALKQIA